MIFLDCTPLSSVYILISILIMKKQNRHRKEPVDQGFAAFYITNMINNVNKIKLDSWQKFSLQMLGLNGSKPGSSDFGLATNLEHRDQVNVYIRQTTKIGKKIIMPKSARTQQIMKRVEKQFCIPIQKQIIFYNSKKYTYFPEEELKLHQGSILHIHNSDRYQKSQLVLYLQQINQLGSISKSTEFLVKNDEKVSCFTDNNFKSYDVTLIQSGRKLDLQKTFRQLMISDGTTISVILKQNQLNHEQFEKDFNKLFQEEEETQNKTAIVEPKQANVVENKNIYQIRVQQAPAIVIKAAERQKSSSQEMQNFQPKPNFKKKKMICLKAVKKNPQDSNYIWKRDISFSESKNQNHKLAKALKRKKCRKQKQKQKQKQLTLTLLKEENVNEKTMSPKEKEKLRVELKKLFSSNIGLRFGEKNNGVLKESQQNQASKGQKKERQISEELANQSIF